MQRRDFLKTIPLLALSPLAVGKFGHVPKKRIAEKMFADVWLYSPMPGSRPMMLHGTVERLSNGDWFLSVKQIFLGNVHLALRGDGRASLREFTANLKERLLAAGFAKVEISYTVPMSHGAIHVSEEGAGEWDVLPRKPVYLMPVADYQVKEGE